MSLFICFFFLFILEKHEVFGWGNSEYCQLEPAGIKEMSCNVPVQMKFQPEIGKIVDIAAGGSLVAVLNGKTYILHPNAMQRNA